MAVDLVDLFDETDDTAFVTTGAGVGWDGFELESAGAPPAAAAAAALRAAFLAAFSAFLAAFFLEPAEFGSWA